jgi:IclR family KDG regulon transcriptional repressor
MNGYLTKDSKGHYSLTLKTYEVGISVIQRGNQINLINTVLGDLNKDSGRVAQFSVEDNSELLCLQSIGQITPVFFASTNAGKRSPLYCTSAGKAILSTYSNEDIIQKWEKFGVKPLTQNTHTDVQALLRDIAETRRRNYALDREEIEYGLFCVGSVGLNHTQSPRGAISVSGNTLSGEDEARISQMVINAARRLSGLLGYASANM